MIVMKCCDGGGGGGRKGTFVRISTPCITYVCVQAWSRVCVGGGEQDDDGIACGVCEDVSIDYVREGMESSACVCRYSACHNLVCLFAIACTVGYITTNVRSGPEASSPGCPGGGKQRRKCSIVYCC